MRRFKFKHLWFPALAISVLPCLNSCSDDIELNPQEIKESIKSDNGNRRIKLSSKEQLNLVITKLQEGTNIRSLAAGNFIEMDGDGEFLSLYAANKNKFYDSLSEEELNLIANDEDELEFCLPDSIIADLQFSQLLNEHREIQIGDTIYRYIDKGVGFTHKDNYNQLSDLDSLANIVYVTKENVGHTIMLNSDVSFTPLEFDNPDPRDDGDDGPVSNGSYDGNNPIITPSIDPTPGTIRKPLYCMDGPQIPSYNVRDINFADRGDGGWLHYLWNRIFGRNVVAINYFEKNKKLTFSLCDLNYKIYRKVSAELKLQKKVLGIWWNIKADEMYIGWDAFSLTYQLNENPTESINPYTHQKEKPHYMWNPIENHSTNLLFNLADGSFDYNSNDLHEEYNSALDSILENSPQSILNEISNNKREIGLLSQNKIETIITIPSGSIQQINIRSMQHKFYSKLASTTLSIGYSSGGNFSFKGFDIHDIENVHLHRGIVYGAIKYKGQWLAARISKTKDN